MGKPCRWSKATKRRACAAPPGTDRRWTGRSVCSWSIRQPMPKPRRAASAGVITRALKLKSSVHGGHSAEELKLIVSSSRGLGYLPEAQEDMIHRVLDLDYVVAREIMVPRNDMVSISSHATLDDVLRAMIEQRHSRLPV